MKIERKVTLERALEEVALIAEALKGYSTVIEGKALELSDEVELHIEFEHEAGGPELEFEIKWKAARSQPAPTSR